MAKWKDAIQYFMFVFSLHARWMVEREWHTHTHKDGNERMYMHCRADPIISATNDVKYYYPYVRLPFATTQPMNCDDTTELLDTTRWQTTATHIRFTPNANILINYNFFPSSDSLTRRENPMKRNLLFISVVLMRNRAKCQFGRMCYQHIEAVLFALRFICQISNVTKWMEYELYFLLSLCVRFVRCVCMWWPRFWGKER